MEGPRLCGPRFAGTRTFQAPDKADLSNLNASLENGLLVLHLPKAPESQPRQVPVKVS